MATLLGIGVHCRFSSLLVGCWYTPRRSYSNVSSSVPQTPCAPRPPCNTEMSFATRRNQFRIRILRIVTVDEKWIRYDNLKRRKSWGLPGHASTSTVKPNIHEKNSCCVFEFPLNVLTTASAKVEHGDTLCAAKERLRSNGGNSVAAPRAGGGAAFWGPRLFHNAAGICAGIRRYRTALPPLSDIYCRQAQRQRYATKQRAGPDRLSVRQGENFQLSPTTLRTRRPGSDMTTVFDNRSGNFDVKDEPRFGRPPLDKVDAILEKIEQDQHINSYDIRAGD
ncbi:hypothetical protein EVAR_76826_1 [Eumeta japonica]|uniref:Uncharacterized protein n=1 Tax=Eumeta variegata TaxID=151549 RepID=A0A4C1Z376_EUMVA|nr:hypothetical protein EVAR_76826_1 [Eumeta japonica]